MSAVLLWISPVQFCTTRAVILRMAAWPRSSISIPHISSSARSRAKDFAGVRSSTRLPSWANPRTRPSRSQFKEQRRRWFRDLLLKLPVTDPEGLATQLALLWDGAIATALVRGDPTMANAAKDAARVLLAANVASVDAVSDRQLPVS
jgi:hypothetical protein